MKLKEADVGYVYNRLVTKAHRNVEYKQYLDALKCIEASAHWAYDFNEIYSDPDVENLLKRIADENLPKRVIEQPIENRHVLIDSFGYDSRGLTQQYLRAMMANGIEILYIIDGDDSTRCKEILRELGEYDKVEICLLTGNISQFDKCRSMIDRITDFSPSRILLHLYPWETVALMTIHSIKGAQLYNINLTDHAYWMGAGFIDYNLEFRGYGQTVSLERRYLKPSQLIGMPYYPIQSKYTVFQGFPELPADAVKIFTGGSMYKMLGENDMFFKIMDTILSVSSRVVILVAGFDKNSLFTRKVNAMKYGDRVIEIGVRRDISEVFKNIDIYLGTYPICGGLMSQYAAMNAKPIIAYHSAGKIGSNVAGIVNHFYAGLETCATLDEVWQYAKKLVEDEEYRLEQGTYVQKAMITNEQFNEHYVKGLQGNGYPWDWQKENINYSKFFRHYLDLENYQTHGALRSIVATFRFRFFTMFSRLALHGVVVACQLVWNKIMVRIKSS